MRYKPTGKMLKKHAWKIRVDYGNDNDIEMLFSKFKVEELSWEPLYQESDWVIPGAAGFMYPYNAKLLRFWCVSTKAADRLKKLGLKAVIHGDSPTGNGNDKETIFEFPFSELPKWENPLQLRRRPKGGSGNLEALIKYQTQSKQGKNFVDAEATTEFPRPK